MAHADPHPDAHHGHHIVPKKTLLIVFGALVFLTILTVVTSRIHLGVFHLPLALAIAITKGALVVTFFMALKFDNRVNTLVFSIGLVFVLVFLVFTLFDTAFRGDIGNMSAQTIADMERADEALQAGEAGDNPMQTAGLTAQEEDTTAGPNAALIARGRELYQQQTCIACHSTDGTQVVGPSFQGLLGRERTFADGSTLVADSSYIRQSIREPTAHVVEGFQPVMPPFTALSDEDVTALVAFVSAQ